MTKQPLRSHTACTGTLDKKVFAVQLESLEEIIRGRQILKADIVHYDKIQFDNLLYRIWYNPFCAFRFFFFQINLKN